MKMKDWLEMQIEANRKESNDAGNSEVGTRTVYFSGKMWAMVQAWEKLTGQRHPLRGGEKE